MSTHLHYLELQLSNERSRLADAKSDSERELRKVWVSQLEREIAKEIEFLGGKAQDLTEIDDDELLAELAS